MIEKRTVIDQIEIRADTRTIQVRFLKQLVEDGKVISQEYHRTSIEPGTDVDMQMGTVNSHLFSMGCATVEDYEQLKQHCAVTHTEEVITKFQAEKEAATAVK